MPRFVSLLGLGVLVGGVLYWRKRNAEPAATQPASGAGLGEGAGGPSAPEAAATDVATPASTVNAASTSNPTAASAATANPPTINARASNAGTRPAAAATAAAPSARPIKGNVHGSRQLYHLPDDESYDQVLEDRTFATVEEAEAAGFRHAGHPRD